MATFTITEMLAIMFGFMFIGGVTALVILMKSAEGEEEKREVISLHDLYSGELVTIYLDGIAGYKAYYSEPDDAQYSVIYMKGGANFHVKENPYTIAEIISLGQENL